MVTQPDTTKSRRTRTLRQLQRKRTQDKASQKQKRERYKAYVQRIEQDLHEALKEIEYLRGVIRAAEGELKSRAPIESGLQASIACKSPPECLSPSSGPSDRSTLLAAEQRITVEMNQDYSSIMERSTPVIVNLSTDHQGYQNLMQMATNKGPEISASWTAATVNTDTLNTLPQTSIFSPSGSDTATCTCDPQVHMSYADCFEQTVFTALMEAHRLPRPYPLLRQIAPNPSMSDLLFFGKGEHVVTKILNKVLRRPNPIKLSILFAAYLIVYRVLRYRFFPSLQTFHDIPDWLRPTDAQDSVPHPIFLDFVHFPQLRAAMVLGRLKYDRAEFEDDYSRWLCFNWPDSRDLLIRNHRTGGIVLNPDFESQVFTMNNWSVKAAFVSKYPHVASLVNIES